MYVLNRIEPKCASVFKYLHIIFGMAPVSLGVQIARLKHCNCPSWIFATERLIFLVTKFEPGKTCTHRFEKLVWSINSALSLFFALILFLCPLFFSCTCPFHSFLIPLPPHTHVSANLRFAKANWELWAVNLSFSHTHRQKHTLTVTHRDKIRLLSSHWTTQRICKPVQSPTELPDTHTHTHTCFICGKPWTLSCPAGLCYSWIRQRWEF